MGSRGGDRHGSPSRPSKLPGKAVTVTTVTIKPTADAEATNADASSSLAASAALRTSAAATPVLTPPPAAATAADASSSEATPKLVPATAAARASKPGGAKQLGGSSNYGAIYPKVDEELLISNIHEAYKAIQKGSTSPPCGPGFPLKLPERAAADGMSPPPSPAAHSSHKGTAGQPADRAASEAIGGPAGVAGTSGSAGGTPRRPQSRSEPGFTWAPNSPEPPSWLRMPGASNSTAAAGDGGDRGMSSLEEDLQHVVHLYPPGRVLWILSDDIVGPAGNQLVQAVEAHLPGTKRRRPPASTRRGSAEQAPAAAEDAATDAARLRPPSEAPMDAGASRQQTGGTQQRRGSGHERVVVTPAAAAEAQRVRAAAAQQAGQVAQQATEPEAKEAAEEAIDIAESPVHTDGGVFEASPVKRARLQAPSASQQQQSQQRPQQQQPQHRRSSSGLPARASSMEVDGSAAGPGSDDFVFVPSQPPELQQLMALLGSVVDAGSAIAIAHKRSLLLEHFRQQQADLAAKELATQQQELQELRERQSIHRAHSLAHRPDSGGDAHVELASATGFVDDAPGKGTSTPGSDAGNSDRAESHAHAGPSLQPQLQQESVLSSASLAVREAAAAQQQLQLSTFQQSDEYMAWRRQQEELNRQLLQRQQSSEAAGVPANATTDSSTGASAAGGLVGGLQGAALESLIELASLPERLTDGLMSLRLNSALCVSGLLGSPGAGSSAAAAEAEARRRPVVVEPDAEVFSQLLLHKNAIQDHIPDRYMEAIQRLIDWYS